ncbi:MAG: hypothetical protein F6J86_10450 [Symploca sp. SIO1B1]|nr:hypothetical protein [Symploca sp. SIO1C2]NER46366.1 hypothetical protein [Symploca sp. SIO1A3]NER94243.1 hypothetical protein [Symploca sp. SIO1B1]
MLSNDVTQKSMIQRIEQMVTLLMEERPLFKEDLDYSEMVDDLAQVFQKNLTVEEFNTMSEKDLKERCSGIMSINLLSTIGSSFTPEEMAIFDDAIKRK